MLGARRGARSAKTKVMGGRIVSAKSKTGDPQCSEAMSAKVNARLGNPISMALDVANAILGKCRSKAHSLKQAGHQRAAGNEARAQHLEHRARSGGPVTAKDRLAKTDELRSKLVAQRQARSTRKGGDPSAAVKASATPLHEEAYAAAHRVPESMRFGENKVFLHHAHDEYKKAGGKLSLEEFKHKLAHSAEGRGIMSRADLVQAMKPEDVRASNAEYHLGMKGWDGKPTPAATFNFITVGRNAPQAKMSAASLRDQAAKARVAQETRIGKLALAGHVGVSDVKAERQRILNDLLPVRREQQRIMRQEDYRFTKTPYESSDWLRKGAKQVTKPYSYTDSKGDLPSYYGSKARAAKFLAKHNLAKAESDARAAKEAAKVAKRATGRQLAGIGSAAAYRYKEAAKAAFKPKGFKAQDITLTRSDKAGNLTEKAQVKGIYGVHKSGYGNAYTVTHLPTGLSTGLRLDTQTRAKEIVESLNRRKIDLGKMVDTPEARKRAKRMVMAMQLGR